jgi:polysaccharide pyruvyl transferase WcaK-like protein
MITIDKCPICSSEDTFILLDNGEKFAGEKVNFCNSCGLAYLSPRMDDEEIKEYYLSDSFSEDFRGESERGMVKRDALVQKSKERWNGLEPFLFGGTLLEIGCSSGEFLEIAKDRFEVYGIDASTGYANSSELDIHIGQFPDYDFSDVVDKFDVIATFHTLEHVPDPQTFLNAVYERLDDDGVFIIEYPDLSLAAERTFLPDTYFQKSHLYDFSNFNISLLLVRAGFRVNFATILNPNYPNDKNLLVVCTKSDDGPLEAAPMSDRAADLAKKLTQKLKGFNVNLDRKMRIVHVASHHINIGDGAISYGIREGLTQATRTHIDFFSIDIVDYANFDAIIKAEDLEQYEPDLIIVGGGGTIDGHDNRTQTGTAFRMPLEELDKLSAPIGFVGLGHNTFPGQDFHKAEELSNFIEYCRDNEIPFSVRRDKSWERMHNIIDDDLMQYVDVVPDPGFFIRPTDQRSPHISPAAKKNVVLQIAPDAYVHRYGSKEKLDEFMDSVAEYILWLVSEYSAHIIIATHTLDDLWTTMTIMNKKLPNNVRRLHVRATGIYHPVFAREFFNTYAQSDLVVGMRGHSVICGTGLKIPTLGIGSHDKVFGYMEEAGASEWCIPVGGNIMPSLYVKTAELLSDDGASRQVNEIMEATDNWPEEYYLYLNKILGQLT